MFDAIAGNRRRSYLLLCCVVLLLAAVIYSVGLYYELGYWFGLLALLFALGLASGSYYYSDSIVLSMSNAHPVAKEDEPYLHNTVEGLAIAAGLPMPKVYIIEDSAPNAFATGRDPEHATVAVTRGLLEKMNRLELEGVVAHEMSHIGSYDIRFMTLVAVLVGTVALLADWMLRIRWHGGRGSRRGGHPIIALIALFLLIFSPIIAQLMKLALSRQREHLADATAAKLTRYPRGLASALEKLAADTEPLEVANKATAHLYIINPLTEHKGMINSLFATHPPIGDRVVRLRSM
jgi:heat shock protein HtpX